MNNCFFNHITTFLYPNQTFGTVPRLSDDKETKRKWIVTPKDVAEVPTFYPLERTHKVITNMSLDSLSSRLLECIRTHNIAVTWDEKNPTQIYCSTNNFLQFEINIWKRDDSNKDGKHETISGPTDKCQGFDNYVIDIRRHDGDCVSFHHLRTELFNFLCNPDSTPKKDSDNSNFSSNLTIPPEYARPLTIDDLMDILSSVTTAFELIFNPNSLDTVTGLQMLMFLTDAESIHRVYAGHVCDFIILGHDVFGHSVPAVRDVIYNYAVNERSCIEHHHALQILANSFKNCTLQNHHTNSNNDIDLYTWNSAIPALIVDIENVETNPHVAFNAMKCIRFWFILAGPRADKSHNEKILKVIERTESFGRQWYISLAEESVKLRNAMD